MFIVDRAKDMVLRGGENIYCTEVETAIYQHDAVAEAAVFGVPDDRLGEIVGAAIVLAPGASLTEGDLQSFLAGEPGEVQDPRTNLDPRRSTAAQCQRQVHEARTQGIADRLGLAE